MLYATILYIDYLLIHNVQLALPSVRGSLLHALNTLCERDNAFPSNVTHLVQQLTLFPVQTEVNLFRIMVHFPALISLTLVWPVGQSQAQFVVPANYAQPLALDSLTFLNIQGTLPWDHFVNFVQRCNRLAFLRIGWPYDGDMPQFLAMCPRLQYLWFDTRHDHVPPTIPMDAVTVPHPQQHAHDWTHLRQLVAFHPSIATYRGIIATLQAYQHVYLNTVQIRISPRWRERETEGLQLLAMQPLPSLSELVFAVHPVSTVVADPLLHHHVISLMDAAPNIQRFSIRLLHRGNMDNSSLAFFRANPLIPTPIMERIMHQMPNLRHLCLHAAHPVGDAVQILRQLRYHQVPLLSFDWLGKSIESIDLFGELAIMPHLQWVALATKEWSGFAHEDLTRFLDRLGASQTITWLVLTHWSGFYNENVFNHIPVTVQRFDFYDCRAVSPHGLADWLNGGPNRQSFVNDDWMYAHGIGTQFPPPRSFFVTHEPRYGT